MMTLTRMTVFLLVTASLGLMTAKSAKACGAKGGASVAGPILEVPDNGVICVALGPTPDQWVRVHLAGGQRLERRRLMAAAFAKRVVCTRQGRDGWVCSLDGADLTAAAGSGAMRAKVAAWR